MEVKIGSCGRRKTPGRARRNLKECTATEYRERGLEVDVWNKGNRWKLAIRKRRINLFTVCE